MTTPSFRFKDANTSRGAISSGEGSTEFIHPILPMTCFPASGFLIYLNGWNLNRIQADILGHDGTVATSVRLLQMRAPRQPILPGLTWPGTGRVFRPGAKYRYRWMDTRTGEHSGLSPIPDEALDIGIETPAGSQTFLGQTAYFNIATTDKPPNADVCQLFANTTRQDEVWYLADEKETAGASYVLLTDDNTDDELFTKLSVVTGSPSATPAGPTWSEGIMWPVAKAWQHPSGYVFFFGLRRRGLHWNRNMTVGVTEGSDQLTVASTTSAYMKLIEPGRIGQRIRFYATASLSDPIDDPTVYRIVQVSTTPNVFRITPEIQVSTSLAASATDTWYFSIEDDRDARWTLMGEPGKPWLIDPLKVLAAGDDYEDSAMHWFALSGRIYLQTRRRIYEALGSVSEDPSRSTLFTPRSEEGCVGFSAGCETPFGWVFVHETRGVRLFDGATVSPLGSPDPFADFGPSDQFARFEPSMMEEIVVCYDDEHRVVIVSYVPTGQGTRKETIVFDTTTRKWRGPYRERVACAGKLRSSGTTDSFVIGDDFGALATREAQNLDFVPAMSGWSPTSGTVTTWTDERFLTDSSAAYDGDGDQRLRGAPVWLTKTSDGTLWHARVADIISSTQIELDGPPVREDGTAYTDGTVYGAYAVGSIRWSLVTSYIEPPGDPSKTVEFFYANARFLRGSESESFTIAAAEDANGTYAGPRVSSSSAPADTADVASAVMGRFRLKRAGHLIQLKAFGTTRNGTPQVTRVVIEAEERES